MTIINKILKRFIDIGFNLDRYHCTSDGICNEYKYFPKYLIDTHYTLVVFKYNSGIIDYRLYEHYNNGDYKNSIYQLSNIYFINNDLDKRFPKENRRIKLDKLEEYE